MNWISVDERLPEPHTEVLIYLKEPNAVITGFCNLDDDWSYDATSYWTIAHWMPLPEPPTD